ncbi:MAG: trypsin-like peptidase domain-containing protein [Gemmatimonadota bacterium]
MTDTLRTRLNLIVTAVLAFAVGLAVTAALDFTPRGVARVANDPLVLDIREPSTREEGRVAIAGFSDIAEQITPAVVTIEVEREVPARQLRLPPGMDEDILQPGSGSGFIISVDGYIVTNNHVVAGAHSIEVLLADGRRFDDVRLVGRDATTDVALLKIEAPDLVHAPIGSSQASKVGDWVLAIGSPGFSLGPSPLFTTVTAGIISAKGRNINILGRNAPNGSSLAIEDFIQTDAAINPGNSGGPLVNASGEVIGVNAAIASTTGSYQGYGFAVPMDLVREVIDDLVEFGTVHRAILGVNVQAADDADARYYGLDHVGGALVMAFSAGSPAEEAGLEVGDVIVGVAGRPVDTVSDLQRAVRAYEPDDMLSVEVVHDDGKRETVRVRLASAGDTEVAAAPPAVENDAVDEDDPLGVRVQEIDGEIRRAFNLPSNVEGVVVSDLETTGPFARRVGRLFTGDIRELQGLIITRINREDIDSVADYERLIEQARPGAVVGLTLYNPRAETRNPPPLIPVTVPIPTH